MNEEEFVQLRKRMNQYKHYDSEIKKKKEIIEKLKEKKEVRMNFDYGSTYWLVAGREKQEVINILQTSISELEEEKEKM